MTFMRLTRCSAAIPILMASKPIARRSRRWSAILPSSTSFRGQYRLKSYYCQYRRNCSNRSKAQGQILMQEVSGRKAAAVELDCDRYRLRTFVDRLDGTQLERRKGRQKLSEIATALEGNPKAVLFESAGHDDFPLVGNALGSRSRFAEAFGVPPHQLLPEILRRLRTKPEIVEVDRKSA